MQFHTVLILFVVVGLSTARLFPGGPETLTPNELLDAAIQEKVKDALSKLEEESECFDYVLKKVVSGEELEEEVHYLFVIEADVIDARDGRECVTEDEDNDLTPGENQKLQLEIYDPCGTGRLRLQKLDG